MSVPPAEPPGPVRERPTLSGRAKIDAESRAFRFALILPLLLAATVMVLYYLAQPHWLADPDAQDYAQLGRQLAAGRGPVSGFLPWNGLAYLTERGESVDVPTSWPPIARFPLTPFLMALSFVVGGPNDAAVHLPAALAFVLTAGCAALLAACVYGSWAGFVAGLTVACLPLLVNYSLTGLTEPLLGLLILGVLGCVVRWPGGMTGNPLADARRLTLGGVLLGLAVLNRYDTILLGGAIVALWLMPRADRWRAIARFLLPAAVIVLPWAVYLTVVAGSPMFNLQPASIAAQASGRADGLGWYLPEYVPPSSVWTSNPSRAARIAGEELAATPNHLRKLLGWPWLLAGAAAVLVVTARTVWSLLRVSPGPHMLEGSGPVARSPGRWRSLLSDRLLLVAFLLLAVCLRGLLASLLGLNLQRHFVPLVPLLVVVVAGEADWLLRSAARWMGAKVSIGQVLMLPVRVVLAASLVLPGFVTIAPFLLPPSTPHGPPTRAGEVEARPENLARLAQIVSRGQIVASNVPWSVAWQADRAAVPLPPTVDDTAVLETRFGISLDAIYVAGQVSVADAPRGWRTWDERRRSGTPPPGYVLAETFQNGGRLFVKQR